MVGTRLTDVARSPASLTKGKAGRLPLRGEVTVRRPTRGAGPGPGARVGPPSGATPAAARITAAGGRPTTGPASIHGDGARSAWFAASASARAGVAIGAPAQRLAWPSKEAVAKRAAPAGLEAGHVRPARAAALSAAPHDGRPRLEVAPALKSRAGRQSRKAGRARRVKLGPAGPNAPPWPRAARGAFACPALRVQAQPALRLETPRATPEVAVSPPCASS